MKTRGVARAEAVSAARQDLPDPPTMMFGKSMPDKCAENYRTPRKKGMTIRRATDVIIATFCIEQRMPLLFTDRDLIPFVHYLDLISALPNAQRNRLALERQRKSQSALTLWLGSYS